MTGQYTNFCIASTGASAAFIGLLFVGMSIVNRDDANYATRERRIVLASSAFLALTDVFFVSIISFLGGSRTLATGTVLMAVVALVATVRLIRRVTLAGNFARGFAYRRVNILFAGASVVLYSAQLVVAILLLENQSSTAVIRVSLALLIGLYASALSRAWEITGIGHRVETGPVSGQRA